MLKKSLSVLSGSLLLASTQSQAISINPGDNIFMVFNTAGHGSYWLDLGIGANEFMSFSHSPNAFAIDLTGATAALGGTIESFALLGNLAGEGKNTGTADFNFNYYEGIYVDLNGGLISAHSSSSTNSLSNIAIDSRITQMNQHLETFNIQTGYYEEGSFGDIDSLNIFVNIGSHSLLNDFQNISGAFLYQHLFTTGSSTNAFLAPRHGISWLPNTPEACFSESYDWEYDPLMCHYQIDFSGTAFSLRGDTLTIPGNGAPIELTTTVPIPAAGWLFLCGMGGLATYNRLEK